MIRKTIILLSFALCVLGDEYAISEQHIKIDHKEDEGHHGELTHIGTKKPEHHEEYAWSYPSYEFSYSVHDPHTHDKKGQEESRKGDDVKGEYWLIEPDGRKRTVTYHADKHSGFHAVVHYSDDHHHIVEQHGYGKEENKEEKNTGDDEGSSEEKGQENEKKVVENEDGNEEGVSEEESGEKGGGAEETRRREEGIVRWIYDPKWDNGKVDKRRWDDKRAYDEGRRREENYDRDDKRGRKYNVDSLTVYENLGSYGRRVNKEHDEARRRDDKRDEDEDRDREESLLWEERRKFDERRGYPSHITPYFGHPSRMNPRFYRHYPGNKIASRS